MVYAGAQTSWRTPENRLPGTYYYRVRGVNAYQSGAWSAAQSVRVYPLYVGLRCRYDGAGYIRSTSSFDVGTHTVFSFSALTDADVIRRDTHHWYDPDPQGWGEDYYLDYFSVSTGLFLSSPDPDDPDWKWGPPGRLGYDAALAQGVPVQVGGQLFSVQGPLNGYTAWGTPIQYWQLVNQSPILMWADGSGWEQRILPGDVTLRFDATGSTLKLYSSLKRTWYYDGAKQADTVQYIETLTAATSIAGSPPVPLSAPGLAGLPTGETLRPEELPGPRR